MNFQDELLAGWISNDKDVGFFPHANLIADAVNGRVFLVGVKGEVVEATVGEAVAVV